MRELDLPFGLLPTSKRQEKPELNLKAMRREFLSLTENPNDLLKTIEEHMRLLNRYSVHARQRHAHTEQCLEFFYPLANKIVNQYAEGGKVPENRARAERLDYIAKLAEMFVRSLKHLFQHDYDSPNVLYVKYRDRIYWSAFRILELIHFMQSIRSLRYMHIDKDAWRDANVIYIVMRLYESVEGGQRLLPKTPPRGAMKVSGSQSTMERIFVLIQLSGMLDYFRWPTTLQSFMERYIKPIDQAVLVQLYEGGELPAGNALVYYGQSRPPYYKVAPKKSGPAVTLNFRVLAKQVQYDYGELIKSQKAQNQFLVPEQFRPLKPAYRFPFATLLLGNIKNDFWAPPKIPQLEEKDLRVFSGFEDVYAHMSGIFASGNKRKGANDFRNLLAKRSAMIGADDTADHKSRWYIIEDNKNILHLQTQETKFTNTMHIGSLMAFGFGWAGISKPTLGYVSRIERPENGKVNVELKRVVTYVEPSYIKREIVFDESNLTREEQRAIDEAKDPIQALLVHDNLNGWGVLIPQHPAFWEESDVRLRKGDKVGLFKLGRLRDLSQEFFLFELKGTSLAKFSPPRYPDAGAEEDQGPQVGFA